MLHPENIGPKKSHFQKNKTQDQLVMTELH